MDFYTVCGFEQQTNHAKQCGTMKADQGPKVYALSSSAEDHRTFIF